MEMLNGAKVHSGALGYVSGCFLPRVCYFLDLYLVAWKLLKGPEHDLL